VFEEETYNLFKFREQIIVLLPDSTGVVVQGTAIFKPNTFIFIEQRRNKPLCTARNVVKQPLRQV
jgi:hypothetical protein